ncbi:nucleolar protein 4 isoform X2 [Hippoglossus stenolepis]|uniref:nucleolar protein 4 isoform X2 n=1 Tax=Hippoglossus stenolepis TaxID=195615 RepID=UPI00159C4648|nr:nucleolar protein 4 isoform X2 [Hippoglossus stenolepis]
MTTRRGSGVSDLVSCSTSSTSSTSSSLQQQSGGSAPPGPEAAAGGAEMFEEFQDWCLRTYGDSGKTKTVTRRKYNKILQTLLQRDEENRPVLLLQEKSSGHINAKFKFWVKSKGFQVRTEARSPAARPVLYVPVKCVDSVSGLDSSLKRVAVVEDFFDIIYSMHVEVSSDPGKAPKHAGQKKTYKAIAETYAFLPREAVTHFLMSCGECQKRMHISTTGQDYKENDRPSSLVSEVIDYNMPLTTTYMKQMKLQYMSNKDDSSLSSEEEAEMSEPTWLTADLGAASDLSPPSRAERMRHSPQNAHMKEDDDDSSSESGSGSGLPALTPPSSAVCDGAIVRETKIVNGNGGVVPLDFSTPTSSSSSSEDQQPINLSDAPPQRLPLATSHLPVTVSAAAAALLGALHPNAPEELRRKFPLAAKPPPHPALPLPHTPHTHNANTPNTHSQAHAHTAELRLDRDSRDYGGKSPQYSSGGSYDSVKMDLSAEDLTMGRHGSQVAPDDDDDDHDDHDDNDKITEGVDPERLKAFNMFVRLFVDENLDRMVPISKQPKEKIQAIIESCSRQFPEFQERARKRIRTYLKSCRRMKKNGMETRPTPPHLTSAMAENILASACENESRNAAKRMRLEAYHDEQISPEKPSSGSGGLREPASLAHFSLAASAFSSQDAQLYINGAGLSYGYRGYPGLGAAMPHPLTTSGAAQGNDLSMKSLSSANITNSASSAAVNSLAGRGSGGAGGGGASTQLSQPEITAVRQLIAGYRESAAFLLRSADELENLILQQN